MVHFVNGGGQFAYFCGFSITLNRKYYEREEGFADAIRDIMQTSHILSRFGDKRT